MKKDKLLFRAEQKYIRMSPRKLRVVAKAVEKFSPREALTYLEFLNKRAGGVLMKTIKQALANAGQQKVKEEDLAFAKIEIGAGSSMKRWRPISRGRAHSILKRTSNIKVILESKDQREKIKDTDKNLKRKNERTKNNIYK